MMKTGMQCILVRGTKEPWALRLGERSVTAFPATVTYVHRWNDRKKTIKLPLFSCYLFVKLIPTATKSGGGCFEPTVYFNLTMYMGVGTPIPNQQIDAVRILGR